VSHSVRVEHDLLGDREVPADVYYGVHTARALENFPISGVPISRHSDLVVGLASVKQAAAEANQQLGLLDTAIAEAIIAACMEIRGGSLHDQFVVDQIQGGAGTSTNMNANEVIANRALEILGHERGAYHLVHPLEHANLGQSTNDVYPTAVKVALGIACRSLEQALGGLVDALGQAWRFTCVMVASDRVHATDRTLATAAADTIEHVADVMDACARGKRARAAVRIDVEALVAARRRHRDLMHEAASAGLRMHTSAATIVGRFAGAFPVRILSFVALSMAVDAAVMAGRTVEARDDFVVLEPTTPMSALRHALRTLRALLVPETAWFHNSLRAALGLSAAMVVAKVIAIGHGFWVVLATLGVLRSNVVTTGATIVNALAGTFVGFGLAFLAMHFLAPYPTAMWLTLPLVVFAAAYANHAISFGAAQALFALLVVEMFNLVEPEGWMTGVVRLEAVAIGAMVALFVSVVMWPKGAASALREQIAEHVRAAQALVDAAFASLFDATRRGAVEAARDEALDVRRRCDEALAAFMGERGAKRIAPETWIALARAPVLMRLAADAVIALERGGYHGDTSAIEALLREVRASFLALADRLAEGATADEGAWRAVVADLDMIGGAGLRVEPILRELEDFVEAHRGDPGASRHVVAVVWGLGWLGYLAHVRMSAEPAVAQVVAASVEAPLSSRAGGAIR